MRRFCEAICSSGSASVYLYAFLYFCILIRIYPKQTMLGKGEQMRIFCEAICSSGSASSRTLHSGPHTPLPSTPPQTWKNFGFFQERTFGKKKLQTRPDNERLQNYTRLICLKFPPTLSPRHRTTLRFYQIDLLAKTSNPYPHFPQIKTNIGIVSYILSK